MKFYQFPHSPYCIPISLLLKNGGIAHEEILVPNWDRSLVIEVTEGKYYQVPVLVDDDNGSKVIYETSEESLEVAQYINGLVALDLFPEAFAGVQEVMIQYIESELEGIGFKTTDPFYTEDISNVVHRTVCIRHKERKFGKGCLEKWKENHQDLLKMFYQKIDNFKGALTEKPFLFGKEPVYADYALYGVLGNVHYYPQNVKWENREWLQSWKKRLEEKKV